MKEKHSCFLTTYIWEQKTLKIASYGIYITMSFQYVDINTAKRDSGQEKKDTWR